MEIISQGPWEGEDKGTFVSELDAFRGYLIPFRTRKGEIGR